MKKTTKPVRKKLRFGGSSPVAGAVYACAIGFALMYAVCFQQLLICTVAMCAAVTAVYAAMFLLHKSPVGGAVMTAILTVSCFGVIGTLGVLFMDFVDVTSGGTELGEDSFIYFLFTPSAEFTVPHAAMTIGLFSVVIGFTCCYFSVTMPRIGFLLLPALIPLILSLRTSDGLPMWVVVLLFAAYIMAACCTARPLEEGAVFSERSAWKQRTAAAAVVGVFTVLTAAALPKSEETVFRQFLDSFATNSGGFFSGGNVLESFNMRSSVNTGNNTPSEELLFTVNTDCPDYIDRAAYDDYTGEYWTYREEYDTGYPNWQQGAKALRPSELFSALKKGAEEGLLPEYYEEYLLNLPKTQTVTGNMLIVMNENSWGHVVPHPCGTYDASIRGSDLTVYRTERNEFFVTQKVAAGQYLLKYNAEPPCEEYAEAMEQLDFTQLLIDAKWAEVISKTAADAFYDEYWDAMDYKAKTKGEPIPEITELAEEITKDCESGYEKAMAIERWFSEQGFVYDLKFVPESTDPLYFLFESKRGICSDYATALTLLAREAGLAARYMDGFALTPNIRDENGIYHVTAANAHAYTQVYLQGCGWINLDATKYILEAQTENNGNRVFAAAAIAAVTAVLLAVVVPVFGRRIARGIFVAAYPLLGYKTRVRGVYKFTRDIACAISGKELRCTTVGETQRVITNALSLPDEAVSICAAADELLYNNSGSADTTELLRCFKRIIRRKHDMRR